MENKTTISNDSGLGIGLLQFQKNNKGDLIAISTKPKEVSLVEVFTAQKEEKQFSSKDHSGSKIEILKNVKTIIFKSK